MTGRTLGHYQIEAKLGEGGMGVVYRARDTHLDRPVAVKVLAADALTNPERKRRFVQEAKAASALNHPNIITIYDIDNHGGIDYIAMEYVAGQSLDRPIGHQGLPLRDALPYAIQIAAALAAAHQAGIVHRDLKPQNVMVTDNGLVKVLDFGLAKLTEPLAADSSAPTESMPPPRTEEGAILGTVAYMSPEQAEGRRIDPRSDIFSFGSVLYEMLTGRRAFTGETKIATLSAILHQEPPIDAAPAEVAAILARCLRKDPARRFQHMDDLKVELQEVVDKLSSPAPAPAKPRRSPSRHIPVLAAAVLLAVVAVVVWRLRGTAPSAQQPLFTQLTDQPGQETNPSLSPDGKSLVYASRAAGNWDIYVQRVEGKNAINLTKDSPADDAQPAFSPDGERIAFRSEREGGGIFIMGATGESVRRLTDSGYHAAWSPDGKEIVCSTVSFSRPDTRGPDGQLWSVNVAAAPGSAEKKSLTTQGDAVQPHWSPRGLRIAYWAVFQGQRDIWTIASNGEGRPVVVTSDPHLDWNPVWSPDGKYLYFSSDRGGSMNLWRVAIEETTGKVQGRPEPVTTPSPYSGYISFARDGRMAYVQQVATSNIHKVAFDPVKETALGQLIPITQGSRQVGSPTLSPDERWLAFSSSGKQEDLFLIRPDGTGLRQLTDDIHRDRMPRWSPDGKQIAFFSNRGGRYEIWTIQPDGSGLRQLTSTSDRGAHGPVWSPDGTRLAYFVAGDRPYIAELGKPKAKPLPPSIARGSICRRPGRPTGNTWLGSSGGRAGAVSSSIRSSRKSSPG